MCVYLPLYIYKNLYYFICFDCCQCLFFHRLMSFKVQSCVNLNGANRKEDQTQQEKKIFVDRKMFEAIICKKIICHLGVTR